MPAWTDVTWVYGVYLAAAAWLVPRFAPARVAASATAGLLTLLRWTWPAVDALPPAMAASVWVVVPSLTLLAAYRVSGAFFVRPSARLERALGAVDEWLLRRTGALAAYRAAGVAVHALVELFYLCVYLVVPLGAVVVVAAAREAVPTYWTTVFLAELACYAALPWLQSRPPRAIETLGERPPPGGGLRRLNLLVLRHGSIQVNTVPSAHAAGAVAVALAVFAATPAAGVVFLVLAAGITIATVLGRYHYALDSILGVGVAVAVWRLMAG
jgi:hypothetical protein